MNVVIMAGGKGTRFWPRSVDTMPKQFLHFHSNKTLIQETVDRFRKIVPASNLFIAVPERYLHLVEEQLPGFSANQLIVEPQQKDTAACIALAASRFIRSGDDAPVVFVPSDQYVAEDEPFLEAVRVAVTTAEQPGAIATLGIEPSRPETGFGYLQTSPDIRSDGQPAGVRRVLRFLEKPSEERAAHLIAEPDVYWNSGIFVCRPSTIADSLARFQPAIWNSLQEHPGDDEAAYAAMPQLSIDYAVMELADSLYCIPVRCGWDDIGSWAALRRHLAPDSGGNVIKGSASLAESTGNIIFIEDKEALIVGVRDLIVVSTATGLLICPKSEEPRLKTWLKQTLR